MNRGHIHECNWALERLLRNYCTNFAARSEKPQVAFFGRRSLHINYRHLRNAGVKRGVGTSCEVVRARGWAYAGDLTLHARFAGNSVRPMVQGA